MAEKLKRTPEMDAKKTSIAEINSLIEDMLANGTGGDRTKWSKVFGVLSKDKKAMQQILKIDSTRAFEVYYAMGEDRNLTKLSKKTGHEKNKLGRWRKKFHWEYQIAERDKLVSDTLKIKAVSSVVQVKLEYSNMINKVLTETIENMDYFNSLVRRFNSEVTDPVKLFNYKSLIGTAGDFVTLLKMELELRGEGKDGNNSEMEYLGSRESLLEEQVENDPETKLLIRSLWQRTKIYKGKAKQLAKQIEKEIDVTEAED